jgi:serine/threonine-protein kinase
MLAHVQETPESPSQRAGTLVPPDLEKVVLRCLEKLPAQRFQHVRDLDAALAKCEVGRPWSNDDARQFWSTYLPSRSSGSGAETATQRRTRR